MADSRNTKAVGGAKPIEWLVRSDFSSAATDKPADDAILIDMYRSQKRPLKSLINPAKAGDNRPPKPMLGSARFKSD